MMPNDDTPAQARWRALLGGTALALSFLSRLPAGCRDVAAGTLATAVAAFPIAGMLLGAAAGLVYLAAWKLGLYPLIAATVTIAFLVWLTRGLHEDGLADFADGMAGATPEQRLAIMRDSRIGSFGVLALGLALALRITAVAEIADPTTVLASLAASAAVSRALMAVPLWYLPPAREDGLGRNAGVPRNTDLAMAIGIALLAGFLLLPWPAALAGSTAAGLAVSLVGWLARRKLGGQTGDVLGTAQQAAEVSFLLAGAVLLA
jgi:adenosylcobinamide-GDP ribazoletransferase